MHALGKYLLYGRVQAIGTIVAFALASLSLLLLPSAYMLLPIAYILSGTLLGLVTLRKGVYIGLQVWFGASLLLALITTFAQLPIQFILAYILFLWLPIWFCASVLHWRGQQGMLISAAGLLAVAVLVFLYLALGDAVTWQEWLGERLEQALSADKQAEHQELLLSVAGFMNVFLAAGLMLNIITALLLSRWWQALLFNPDGFRKEFYQLRMPAAVLVFAALAFVALLSFGPPWGLFARDVLIIIVLMFLFEGLALTHRTVAHRKLSRFWLILLYFSLLLVPQSALFLACIGIVDNGIAHHRRLSRSGNA